MLQVLFVSNISFLDEIHEVWVSVLLDGCLKLHGGDFAIIVLVNVVEDLLDILSPALFELEVVDISDGLDGLEDLLEGPGTIIVGINGIEDSSFNLSHGDLTIVVLINVVEDFLDLSSGWWVAVVLSSAVFVDDVHDLIHGEGTITVGIDGLEHLIEWHL